jgi:glycyl-tRNA synthetase alpha chain
MGRIRNISRSVAQSYLESRERLGYPMAPRDWVAQVAPLMPSASSASAKKVEKAA